MRWSLYNTWVELGTDERGRRVHHVHNGRSGRVVTMAAPDREHLDRWVADGSDARPPARLHDLIVELVTACVLVGDHADELAHLRDLYASAASDPSHLGLTVVTSMGCNFDCPYCFEDKSPAIIGDDVADAVVALVDDRVDELDQLDVTWYGGEPLLGRHALFRLARRLVDRCDAAGTSYRSTIVTNGWLLDRATAIALAEHRVQQAQVTIDGPREVHDRMRPHRSGISTFDRIVANVLEASEHLHVTVRVNVDTTNLTTLPILLEQLAAARLHEHVPIALGHIAPIAHTPGAPSASYGGRCLSRRDFGEAELLFAELAGAHGFTTPDLPTPRATPCTAVHRNEVVVGARGELWKCLDDAGNADAAVGSIFEIGAVDTRVRRWFAHDPFRDAECRTCIALPGCMGGCHLYASSPELHDARCSTFRDHHVERVRSHVVATRSSTDATIATEARDASDARTRLVAFAQSCGHGGDAGARTLPVPVSLSSRPTRKAS